MNTRRINLWSGPRNVSTALMYSFAQRSDTQVVDEPLYGHYLEVTDVEHPGREDVIEAMECDADRVIHDLILGPCDRPVLFMKQMAHHLLPSVDRGFLRQTVNVILTRDPVDMLPSLVNQLPSPTLRDTGYAMQRELLEQLTDWGQAPPILDSRELLMDPSSVLSQLCDRIGIPFEQSMLSWPAAPRPEDGVWAEHWYHNVHKSTGFIAYAPKSDPFPDELRPLLAQCGPIYEQMMREAIRAES